MFTRRTMILATAAMTAPAAAAPSLIVRGDRLFLDIMVNGQPMRALLDSAAEMSFADTGFARRLGLGRGHTVTARGSGGDTDAEVTDHVRVEVLGQHLSMTVAVLDLKSVSAMVHAPVDFVLGRELFDAARLAIDIEAGSIRAVGRGQAPPGRAFNLITERGIETFPVSIEGLPPASTVFDLGNGSHVLIGAGYAQKIGLLKNHKAAQFRGGGIGGQIIRQSVMLRQVEIAGRIFRNVAADIDPTDSAARLNIGVSLLRHFRITTDFAARKLWLA